MSFNFVIQDGNLTRDPEFSVIASGTNLCKFSIAVNKKYKVASGELKEDVNFFDIECWGKLAEICNKFLKKGSRVLISGELKQDRFQDKDGNNKSKIKIVASQVQFLSGVEKSENGISHETPDFSEPNFSGEGVPF